MKKKFYLFFLFMLACSFFSINANTLKVESVMATNSSVSLQLIYQSGKGLIGNIEVGDYEAMHIYFHSAVSHVRIDWRDYNGNIVYSSNYFRNGSGYAVVPSFYTDYFTISAETSYPFGEIFYTSETQYYNVIRN